MTTSPFPTPTMQCNECGKPPHSGYCYPILDLWLAVFFAVTVVAVVAVVVLILAA